MGHARRGFLAALATIGLTPVSLEGAVPPRSPIAEKIYRHPDLSLSPRLQSLTDLPPALAADLARDAAALGVGTDLAFYDARWGRLTSLLPSQPLLPGKGIGNSLTWAELGARPGDEATLREAVWATVLGYLDRHRAVLGVDAAELSPPRIGVFEKGSLIQVWSRRVIHTIPVRDSSITAVINHGNLVLLGLQNWGELTAEAAPPQLGPEDSRQAVVRHLRPHAVARYTRDPHLEYVPLARGAGYAYRLTWVVRATVRGDLGNWEGLVDAATGELLAFQDTNLYAARRAIGGVYPVSNDQRPPDGIEQPGWPLPFLHVTTPSGPITTNAAGAIGCASGTLATALAGRYARISNMCGPVQESSSSGDLDLSFGPTPAATDCAVPPGHSPGDTKAARTTYYALTRINEQARPYLPGSAFLQGQVVGNVHAGFSCGGTWNGTGVVLGRDGINCRNQGEIPGVAAHEWGHGMDVNGVNPTPSRPAEGIADIHAFLPLAASCIARGFLKNNVCFGYGDACIGTPATGCTGLRDIDFDQRACGRPHTVTWATTGFPAGHCIDGLARPACPTGSGPCNRVEHCEGALVGEAAFDLARRDLPAAGHDANTAHELTTRLFLLASQAVDNWYTCTVGGGCGATGGYLLTLAADDDDGNIANGTPHMTAIRAAFERHEIHCATPAAVDSGCAGGPSAAPVLSAVPQDQGVSLSWTPVAAAARYDVYRTEGVNGETFGKVKVAEVTGTAYVDLNLQNGRQYHFLVLPVGANGSCFGAMSNAVPAVPVGGANLSVRPGHALAIAGGDGDAFLDNCELGSLTFTVENAGSGPLTGVRLVGVAFLSHPATILQTPLPAPVAATLGECASADGAFAFTPQGLAMGDTLQVRVELTADQLGGQVRSMVFSLANTELDAAFVAARTFDFDTDLQGWTVEGGTWTRQVPGAQGTSHHLSSSENMGLACDVIRSPAIRIRADSTLALHARYQIEPNDPIGGPYDRANVGLRDTVTGARTVIAPSGGQLYTVPAGSPNGTCEQTGQAGWNGNSAGFPAFNGSTWNAGAFNPSGTFTGRVARIEIRYGTDAVINPAGFDYDQVTITSFDELMPDGVPDTCAQAVAPSALRVDAPGNSVLEPGELAVMAPTWRNTGTQAITLSGATSGFTGPPGPTYANPDAGASYGTVPVAGSASCSSTGDCYTVAVTAPQRPATHWDSTIVETMAPASAAKTWTLHVGGSFTDVPPASGFYRFVETLLHGGVTGGCGPEAYCPGAPTTREQMAVFVLVSREGSSYLPPACTTPLFADVPAASPFCRWVEELARRGVVGGCAPGLYCPQDAATREQMAVFVLRTLDPALSPPACTTPLFADVPASSPFCRWIEELVRRGVVTGCGGGNYCPTAPVTREQMAVFLAGTFGLLLYGL